MTTTIALVTPSRTQVTIVSSVGRTQLTLPNGSSRTEVSLGSGPQGPRGQSWAEQLVDAGEITEPTIAAVDARTQVQIDAGRDAAINAAVSVLRNGVAGGRDTLKKLSDAIDAEAGSRAAAITAAIASVLANAGPAYDTLKELQDIIVADETAASALATLVANNAAAIAAEPAARDAAISSAVSAIRGGVAPERDTLKELSDAIDAEVAARTAAISTAISNLVAGAGTAYDTLKELQDLIVADEGAAAALATSVSNNAAAIAAEIVNRGAAITAEATARTAAINAAIGTALRVASNLSDLSDVPAARLALSVQPTASPAFTGTVSITPSNNANGLSISGSSVTGTGTTPLVGLAQTWNTSGAPTALTLTITDTASAATSKLFNLLVGATSIGSLTKGGLLTVADGILTQGSSGVKVPSTASFAFTSRGGIAASADGKFLLVNNASNNFTGLQFGSTGNTKPGLFVNGAGLEAKLADSSAFTTIKGKLTTDTAYTAGAPTATGYITLYDSAGTAYRVPCTI